MAAEEKSPSVQEQASASESEKMNCKFCKKDFIGAEALSNHIRIHKTKKLKSEEPKMTNDALGSTKVVDSDTSESNDQEYFIENQKENYHETTRPSLPKVSEKMSCEQSKIIV